MDLSGVIARLKEAQKLCPSDAPGGIEDTLWRLHRFLEQLTVEGEEAAKKADPAIWSLIFKD